MRLINRPLILIFAACSILLSFISFVGMGYLEGFLNETEDFETGFFVLDAMKYLTPIKRYLHMAIIPAFLGLLMIIFEGFPIIGKRLRGKYTISPSILSFLTLFFIAAQTIPPIYTEEHIFFSNPTYISDFFMKEWHGYLAFTIVYVLSIGSGMVHNLVVWLVQKKNSTEVQVRNGIVSLGIMFLIYTAIYGLFKWGGFYLVYYNVMTTRDFILVYSVDNPFQGVVKLLEGPISNVTHLIVLPGFIGLTSLSLQNANNWFKKISKGDKESVFHAMKISKLSLFSLIIIAIQLLPVILFGINEKIFFLKTATWLSDAIMNWVGYPAFTFSYFIGLVRSMTGVFKFGKYKPKKK